MNSENVGEKLGFIFTLILSSIILFFILKILDKMPESWNYFHVLILVCIITLIGAFIKKLLK